MRTESVFDRPHISFREAPIRVAGTSAQSDNCFVLDLNVFAYTVDTVRRGRRP